MILEYICPNPDCETDLRVPEGVERVVCDSCHRPVKINYDADYVNGLFVDRTSICLADI